MKNALYLIVATLLFSGCNVSKNETDEGQGIDRYLRSEIFKVNQAVLNCLNTQDDKMLKSMISPIAIKAGLISDTVIRQFRGVNVNADSIYLLGEFYVKRSVLGTKEIPGTIDDSIGYNFSFTSIGKESYIYIYSFPGKIPGNRLMASLVFSKEDGIWKLASIDVGYFAYKNKTAIDYIISAKKLLSGGNYGGAVLYSEIAKGLLYPGNNQFHYKIQREIKSECDTIAAEFAKKLRLPIILNEIKSRPQLLQLHIQQHNGQLFPLVLYRTLIDLNDSGKLRNEYLQVAHAAESIFPSLKNFSDTVIYSAVDTMIPGQKINKYHEFYAAKH